MTKQYIRLFFILLGFWFLLHFKLTIANLITGLLVAGTVTFLSKGVFYNENGVIVDIPPVYQLVPYFFRIVYEIYVAAWQMMITIIRNNDNPFFFSLDLDVENHYVITLIANSITLTPGTITVDKEGHTLTVLAIADDGQEGKTIAKDIKAKFQKFFVV